MPHLRDPATPAVGSSDTARAFVPARRGSAAAGEHAPGHDADNFGGVRSREPGGAPRASLGLYERIAVCSITLLLAAAPTWLVSCAASTPSAALHPMCHFPLPGGSSRRRRPMRVPCTALRRPARASVPFRTVESERLKSGIETTEHSLREQRLELDPADKAQVVAAVYDLFAQQRSPSTVARVKQLIAGVTAARKTGSRPSRS